MEPARPDGWTAVERSLGTGLPGDFKAFTEWYGSGTVDEFLYLFNPFTAGQDGNLLVEKDRVLAAYRQTRARFPQRLPLPPFPEPGGVLPLGRIDNGDELSWVTEGHPDRWPVALVESRAALQELHAMPVTGFLAALAATSSPPASSPPTCSAVPATGSPRSVEPRGAGVARVVAVVGLTSRLGPWTEPEALDGVVVDLQNLQPPAIARTFSPPVATVAELVLDQPGRRGMGSLGEFHPQVGKVMDGQRPGQDQGPSGSWWADAMWRSNSS